MRVKSLEADERNETSGDETGAFIRLISEKNLLPAVLRKTRTEERTSVQPRPTTLPPPPSKQIYGK
jgi:hypothetical protein